MLELSVFFNEALKGITFVSLPKLNKDTLINTASSKLKINFIEWLVGLTEDDGTFTIATQQRDKGTYYYCIFKISQSAYNKQLLEYIQYMLGCSGIYAKDSKEHIYDFRIVGKEQLLNVVVPIFNQYPCNTIKYYRYLLFLEALKLDNPYDYRFAEYLSSMSNIPLNYESPHLYTMTSKSWIVGFVEAVGSFYITERVSRGTLEHGFNLVQQRDVPILHHIKKALNISANVFTPRVNTIG